MKLVRRLRLNRELYVDVVYSKMVDEYEYLDVIWVMDVKDKVFGEVKEVLWKMVGEMREVCRVLVGCEGVEEWKKLDGKGENVRVGEVEIEVKSGESSEIGGGRKSEV